MEPRNQGYGPYGGDPNQSTHANQQAAGGDFGVGYSQHGNTGYGPSGMTGGGMGGPYGGMPGGMGDQPMTGAPGTQMG